MFRPLDSFDENFAFAAWKKTSYRIELSETNVERSEMEAEIIKIDSV